MNPNPVSADINTQYVHALVAIGAARTVAVNIACKTYYNDVIAMTGGSRSPEASRSRRSPGRYVLNARSARSLRTSGRRIAMGTISLKASTPAIAIRSMKFSGSYASPPATRY